MVDALLVESQQMKAFLLLILWPIIPAKAEQSNIKCPGNNTIEMRWCVSKKLDESNAVLSQEKKLSSETLR